MEENITQNINDKKTARELDIEARKRAIKMKRFGKYLVVVLILALVGYGGYKLVVKRESKPTPGVFFEAQTREHITVGESHPEYNSNPPTGGWHYNTPAQTGIYDREIPDETIIHNLEHSHVWISYRPDLLDQENVEKLADLAKKYGPKMIMTPRVKNDSPVAIVAWQYLLKFDEMNDETLRQMDEFIQYHRGTAGPENPLDFGFGDFRGSSVPSPTPMDQ